MNRYCFWLLFLVMPLWLNGQEVVTLKNAPKKVLKLYNKAKNDIAKNNHQKAIARLEKIVSENPQFLEARLYLGGILMNKGKSDLALEQFETVLKIDSTYNPGVFRAIGEIYEEKDSLVIAGKFYRRYLNNSKRIKDRDKNLIESKIQNLSFKAVALSNPVPFDPKPLSSNINSPKHSEYLPSLTANGERLFFTRVISGQEDIFYAEKDTSGEWTEAVLLPNLNTMQNEGAHSIAADGKTILFTYCSDGRNESARGCNIYAAFKRQGQWSKPVFFDAINSKSWDSQPSISADGKTIVFASTRPGGKGGSDLWISRRNEDGKWTIPANLDFPVNTSGREQSPFLHPDGKTLYFMSDGHPGMGNFDLYMSTLDQDQNWSVPINLGYPINTEGHEGALVVALDGRTAYYSKAKNSEAFDQTHSDIFSFELPVGLRANPVGFAEIKVYDEVTKLPLQANVEIQSSDGYTNTYTTDNEGEIITILPVGQNFSLNIDQKDYYFYSERIELDSIYLEDAAFQVSAYLQPIEVVEKEERPVILKNVLFETGSFQLKTESYFELNRLAELLHENPDLKIEIRGHTDNIGDESDNQVLSENRAKAVYDYLVLQDIDSARLTYSGLGETQPIADNDQAEGRKMNRRTEFVTKQ